MTLTTLALCWRIERRDGVAIGLTDHDRPLRIDGLVHDPAPGMTPSAVSRSDGLDPDTMDITGALSSAAIAPADLVAGRWDGARVALSAVDWEGGGVTPLGEGTLGAIETDGPAFTAELAGPSTALAAPVVEETSPECRAELGDRRCRVPLRSRRRLARVVAVDDLELTLDATEPVAGAYRDGRLRWLGGANCGLEVMLATSVGTTVTLRVPPAFAILGGELIELTEGCDKSIATCAGRFGNAANFRGEPYLPRGRSADAVSGSVIVARARACLGARFRTHGRDPATGLDCVGLAAVAYGIEDVPSGYALRGGEAAGVAALIAAAGLAAAEVRRPGDLLLCASGPGQLHLGIWSGESIIHACTRARRVVERPGEPPWPTVQIWRREDAWRR